jgi:flagellar biosynthesis GTPase FlhF
MSRVATNSELEPDAAPNPVSPYEPHTYRGAALEDLLPKIRAELGPDAIVVRQREGLDGGIGGFFQRRCVEVVARRPAPGIDAYDGAAAAEAAAEPANASPAPPPPPVTPPPVTPPPVTPPPVTPPSPAAPAAEQPVTGAFGASAYTNSAAGVAADPRAENAAPSASTTLERRPAAAAPIVGPPAGDEIAAAAAAAPIVGPPAADRIGAAAAHERTLVAAGIAPALAAELLGATISHLLALGPKRALKHAVREALAHRIPLAPPVASGGRAIAFVGAGGSGKTLCAARLATAYAQHSDLGVAVMSLATAEGSGGLRALLEPAAIDVLDARSMGAQLASGERVMTVIDTAPVSPAAPAEVKRLAAELKRLGAPEVHVAVPATLSSAAVRALLDGFAALRPTAIVLTHLDEVGHAGPVIDEAISRGIAISYTSDGSAADGFAAADPAALAARVLA